MINLANAGTLSVNAKEAIKTSLSVVLVYGIVLKLNWFDPYWAALAVLMVSLPTAGQTIHKSLNRVAGTIPGCIAALVIFSLAAQSRWGFMLLAAWWIFFTTYMMLRSKNNPYMWKIAGFVCLIIAQAGPSSSETLFYHAVFRTMDTVIGISVYTLVSLLLWPRTNMGAIKKASHNLLTTLAENFHTASEVMTGKDAPVPLSELHTKELKQLAQLEQALLAEGSESYDTQKFRHTWEQYQTLSIAVVESLNRWQSGFAELSNIDIYAVLPDIKQFYAELDGRFTEMQQVLDGKSAGYALNRIALNTDNTVLHGLSHFDRLALLLTRKELENLEMLTAEMLDCVRNLADESLNIIKPVSISTINNKRRRTKLPVFDRDHFYGALFAALNMIAGFLIWIAFDPPGHGGYFVIMTIFAMTIAVKPQFNIFILVKAISVALIIGIIIYVFIMPRLSTFAELGLVIFFAIFTIRYLFSGLAQLLGSYGIIKMISIQNEQTYNFISLVDTYILFVLALTLLFMLTYMMRSTRPEKAVIVLQRRFFRSAEFLTLQMLSGNKHNASLIERWKTDYYLYELQTLPTNIGKWGKAINHTLFPDNTPQQVQELVTSLQAIVYRIEQLHEVNIAGQVSLSTREIEKEIHLWLNGIASIFAMLSLNPTAESAADLRKRLAILLNRLDKRINDIIEQVSDAEVLREQEYKNLYLLLGGCRGVSEAVITFTDVAGTIDWGQWRDEVFS